MAIRGRGSFQVNTGQLDGILSKIKASRQRTFTLTKKKVEAATNIMFRVAHQKRPMITQAQAKAEGRKRIKGTRKYHLVSDPNAELGVPVAQFGGGKLQTSLRKETFGQGLKVVGRIWTDLSYAKFIEFGTSRMRARPFMRPAIELTQGAIKAMFQKRET